MGRRRWNAVWRSLAGMCIGLGWIGTAWAGDGPVMLRGDLDGDGRPEQVTVTEDGASQVSLTIISPGKPTVTARNIAWSLEPPSLAQAPNGSLRLMTSHMGIGRAAHEQVLTIAWRRGAWRVVGVTRNNWDKIDPDGASTCDINLLTGRGMAMRPGEPAARPVRVPQRASAVTEWQSPRNIPRMCLGE